MKFMNLNRIGKALGYSYDGLKSAVTKEVAFQQELIACLILIPVACFIDCSLVTKALLIGSLLLVLLVEIMNTAIETLVNMISPDPHPKAKYAKDLGSAAVLIAIVLSGLLWLCVLYETYF